VFIPSIFIFFLFLSKPPILCTVTDPFHQFVLLSNRFVVDVTFFVFEQVGARSM